MTEVDRGPPFESIIRWAESHGSISEAWSFGSRMTGAHDASSDLDVAILLKPGGDALGLYLAKQGEWQNELTAILPFQVDLRATPGESLFDPVTQTPAAGSRGWSRPRARSRGCDRGSHNPVR